MGRGESDSQRPNILWLWRNSTNNASDFGQSQERPVHRVNIRSFAVGKYEVTFDEYYACVDNGGCSVLRSHSSFNGHGRQPVVLVRWHQADQYVSWLSRITGEAYRLLSESEWEYMARAGTTTPFNTGETITTAQANYDGRYRFLPWPGCTVNLHADPRDRGRCYEDSNGLFRGRTLPVVPST